MPFICTSLSECQPSQGTPALTNSFAAPFQFGVPWPLRETRRAGKIVGNPDSGEPQAAVGSGSSECNGTVANREIERAAIHPDTCFRSKPLTIPAPTCEK